MRKCLLIILSVILAVFMVACSAETAVDGQMEAPKKTEQPVEEKEAEEITIPETVLLEEAGVRITAKSLAVDEMFGPELKLLVENDSGKNLTIQSRNTSVNGYMVETMMSVDVADGKKANDSMTFLQADLDVCGIDTIADMEFSFYIFTTEDWETYYDSELIRLETSAAAGYEYSFDDSGDLLYDENGVKIIAKGLTEDQLFGPGIRVYVENTGTENITVQTRDVSVNGFMMDPLFSCDVVSGKRAVSEITFMTSELEENGITDIEEVELSFYIFDMEEWEEVAETDAISISF